MQCAASFETKGGPIQPLVVHDVTKLSSHDIVIGDSRGFVTVFCNEQILTRKVVSDRCICCILLDSDASKLLLIECMQYRFEKSEVKKMKGMDMLWV